MPSRSRISTIGRYCCSNHDRATSSRDRRRPCAWLWRKPRALDELGEQRVAPLVAELATRARAAGGSGTRSRNTRSWRLSGSSRARRSGAAPTAVRTSRTWASIVGSPNARATETRWWPSSTKWRVADAIDVDRRQHDAAAARGGDALPAIAHALARAERAVELLRAAADRAHDGVERDLLDAEVVLRAPAERVHDLLEGQHVRHVVGLGAQPGGDPGEGAPAPLAIEVHGRAGARRIHGEVGPRSAAGHPRRTEAGHHADRPGRATRPARSDRAARRRPRRVRSRAVTAHGLYVAGSGPATGKSAIALGLQRLLARRIGRLGVFRPVVDARGARPARRPPARRAAPRISPTRRRWASPTTTSAPIPSARWRRSSRASARSPPAATASWWSARTSPTSARRASWPSTPGSPSTSACPCSAWSRATRRSAEEVEAAVGVALAAMRAADCTVVAVVANRVAPADARARSRRGSPAGPSRSTSCPEVDLLMAPTVAEAVQACEGEVIAGDPELLGREAIGFVVAAMTLPNLLERLSDGVVVITPGDRADVLLGVLLATASGTLPAVSGVILTGGLRPAPPVLELDERPAARSRPWR